MYIRVAVVDDYIGRHEGVLCGLPFAREPEPPI